jgi:membrane protease YdiL (CAAX protease family)
LTEPDEIEAGGTRTAVDPLAPQAEGPPGGRVFTLEGRAAPGLYLVAWLLSVGGAAMLFVVAGAPTSPGISILAALALGALSLGLAAAAGYQLVARADRHPSLYRGPSPLLLLALVIVAGGLVAGVLSLVFTLDPGAPLPFLASLLVSNLAFLLCIWLFVVRSGAFSWREMGWPIWFGPPARSTISRLGSAIVTGALLMVPTTFAVSLLAGIVATLLDVRPPQVLPDMTTSIDTLAVALAAAVVAPIGEESFFRGFALTAWLRDRGPRSALIRSALLFAGVHILNITSLSFGEGLAQAVLEVAAILPLGLVLGWLFLRHGMAAAIAGHVTYNGLLMTLVLVAPR